MRLHSIVGVLIVMGASVAGTPTVADAGQRSEQVRRVTDGQQLFQTFCATCHGRDGKGHGPTASALKTPPADLTVIAQKNGGTFPRERIARFVANGDATPAHGSKDMPVWGPNFVALAPGSDKLVNPRIDDVVWYLASIQAVTKP